MINQENFHYVQLFVQICVCLCSITVLGSSSCMLSRRAARRERASTTAASRSKASWGGRQTDALMSVWLFVYDLNVRLQKPEALAIDLFFLLLFCFVGTRFMLQQAFPRYLAWQAAEASETIFKLCHTW